MVSLQRNHRTKLEKQWPCLKMRRHSAACKEFPRLICQVPLLVSPRDSEDECMNNDNIRTILLHRRENVNTVKHIKTFRSKN